MTPRDVPTRILGVSISITMVSLSGVGRVRTSLPILAENLGTEGGRVNVSDVDPMIESIWGCWMSVVRPIFRKDR
jgi:hypothetical protein